MDTNIKVDAMIGMFDAGKNHGQTQAYMHICRKLCEEYHATDNEETRIALSRLLDEVIPQIPFKTLNK